MHKVHKSKWRAFKCRNGIHRWDDEVWYRNLNGYVAGCKDCGIMNESKLVYVNGKLAFRDVNLHLSLEDN